jgi:predicted glycosyltransferase involved in capsule biosynthesis
MFKKLELKDSKKMKQGTPTILVPYREQTEQGRSEQLKKFSSHMKRWHPDWKILVIEQSDDGKKFNRGALLNIGIFYANKMGSEYVILHDVDLIPLSEIVPLYTMFPEDPVNIGNRWQSKWTGDGFRGVLSISMKDVKKINGYPNNFWGWGGEDDAMRQRMKRKNISVWNPTGNSGFKEMVHLDTRKIPDAKNMRKWEDLKEDDGSSGLSDVRWKLLSKTDDKNIIMFTVEIT